MRQAAIIFSLLATSMSLPAKAQQPLTIPQINKEVLSAANSYAKAISCVEELATPQTIFALDPLNTEEDFDEAKYLVFWIGDVGCFGGSGTVGFHHAVVRANHRGNFYVDSLHSSPAIDGVESRFIQKFVGNSKDTMVVDQLEHDEQDGNNFPSLKYRVTYQIDDNSGKWKLLEKKKLPYNPQ